MAPGKLRVSDDVAAGTWCGRAAIHNEATSCPKHWRICVRRWPITPARPSAASACGRAGAGSVRGSIRPAVARPSGADAAPGSADAPVAPAFSEEELTRPRLRLPSRDYLLLAGPLEAALQVGDRRDPEGFAPQSPNPFWRADRAWGVASEIDFDSTLVGGTAELVDAILDAPGVDSWAARPDDSLAHDADRVNPMR